MDIRKLQLETNYKGNPMSFVVSKITSISKVNKISAPEETYLFVVGSDDPFTCSESYDVLRAKLDNCLET